MSWANVKLYSDSIPTGEAYGEDTAETITGKDLFDKFKRKT